MKGLLICAIIATVLTHYVLFVSLVLSIPYLILLQPWYVSVPVVVWILNLMTLPVKCPLTELENYLRRKAGLKEIRGFLRAWILFQKGSRR